jgi:hypothetical protein
MPTSTSDFEDFNITSEDMESVGDFYVPMAPDNSIIANSPIQKNKIMGLPSSYDRYADPNNRVFQKTFIYDLPIVNIIPGTPRFLGIKGEEIRSDQDLLDEMVGDKFQEGDARSILNYIQSNGAKGKKDMRYYGFEANFTEYFKYVQQMLSVLHINMGLGTMFSFSEALSKTFSSGSSLPFYMDKATTISEGAANDFGPSQLEGALKTASGLKRELDFIMGKNMSINELEQNATDEEGGMGERIRGIFESLDSLTLKGGVDKVKTVLNGSHMMFPEIWQDSTFTKSYNVSFNFYSPYGTPRSIFHKIYVPLVCLLALTLPRQDTIMGYHSPFIIKMDAPGWFNTSMGVVTSLDFVKGGDEQMWTSDGLPLALKVNMQVKDLYPALMISKSYSALVSNVGIGNFLDNMAGISMMDANLTNQLKFYMQSKLNSAAGIVNTPLNKARDMYTGLIQEMRSGVLDKMNLFK